MSEGALEQTMFDFIEGGELTTVAPLSYAYGKMRNVEGHQKVCKTWREAIRGAADEVNSLKWGISTCLHTHPEFEQQGEKGIRKMLPWASVEDIRVYKEFIADNHCKPTREDCEHHCMEGTLMNQSCKSACFNKYQECKAGYL